MTLTSIPEFPSFSVMTSIMSVQDLKKYFGSIKAVDGISFSIPEGQCFGLLGPNGAGKSTTIEILEGLKEPTSGSVLYKDKPLNKRFREEIGIQFQSTALPEFITVKETIDLFLSFYPHTRSKNEIIEMCSLSDILQRDNQKLSGGQRQRMLLALAILSKPKIVFLDEPTTGLDPQARRHFWDLVNKVKSEGTTVLLTTHYMDEAQSLCDQLVIMDHGKVLEEGTPQNLLNKHFPGSLIQLPNSPSLTKLQEMNDFSTAIIQQDKWEIVSQDVDSTLKKLLNVQINLEGLSIRKPDLEDLFIKLTGGSLRG